MRSNTPVLISATLFALSFTACSDTPLASPAPESSPAEVNEVPTEEPTDPELPSNEELEAYVTAIASDKISTLQEAQSLVQADSPAAGYLKYYTHLIEAQIDAGLYSSDVSSTVEEIEAGFRICREELEEYVCSAYTDFEGKDGSLVNFQLEGRNLSDRLVVGSGETVEGLAGSEFEFIAAYMNSVDSHLIVSYNLSSGDTGQEMPLITYRSEDGRQSQSEFHYGMWSLAPESKSSYVAFFPNAALGGEVLLDVWEDEPYEEKTVVMSTVVE